uniref:AarF domain-containing protein kinase 1 n=1 Tax=Cajanus cajan TaxID=3821 RepID=A0A151S0T0_CAJCA|nr:putative aarF domain-containing protein kinase 1 [Cajanus cajan]
MPKPFNFPAKRTTALFLLTATTAAAAAAQTTNSAVPSPLPAFSADKLGGEIHGLIRTARAVSAVASTVVDYEFSLRGLHKDSDQYRRAISQVHLRSAERFLKLCEANKGFYVKAGQFVASQKVLPKEYSSTLSSLQDQVAPLPFKVIREVLKDNVGPDFSEMFLSIDEQPIAAASIAQVHHAVLKSGHEVAIKVQYPWIEQQMNFDTRTMYFLSKTIAWFFALILLPLDLTTRQVLTMQFYTGHKIDDLDFLNQIGVDPEKVAKSLTELFAEMIFVHGYIHGDPHPGNILVSPEGCNGFSLVLLDHAVYTTLDDEFRKDFCQLWEALILKDSMKTMQLGERFGARKYSRYLPIIFTGTTIERFIQFDNCSYLLWKNVVGISIKEKETLKHELKSLLFEDVSSFMESLPPDFIAILRVDALLRSIIRKMDVSRVTRLLTYTKYAVYGRLCLKSNGEGESCKILGTNLYFNAKAGFFSFISTIKYLHILITVFIGEIAFTYDLILCPLPSGTIDVIPWKQKLKSVQKYLYSKISCDSFGCLVHSVFLLLCISRNTLF